MLVGKVVLVTGAASGIGASTARELYRRGARLILVDVNESGLGVLRAEFDRDRRVAVAGDVCDFDAMRAAVSTGVVRFGGIDAVVANAGVGSWVSLLSMESAEFRRVIDVNVLGVFHTVRAALPALIDSGGYVLVVASVASFVAAPGIAAYSASKAGVEQFATALRLEIAAYDVGVGSAHMSWVDTPLLQRALSDSPGFARMFAALPGPLRRTLSAEDCGVRLATAVDRRSRHVWVPSWVGLARWAKPLLSTRLVEQQLWRQTAQVLEGQS